MTDGELEAFYQEALEERLISYLAEHLGITLDDALDLYYSSRLAEMVHAGVDDIQYLDYRVLTEILCETEGELVGRYATREA